MKQKGRYDSLIDNVYEMCERGLPKDGRVLMLILVVVPCLISGCMEDERKGICSS